MFNVTFQDVKITLKCILTSCGGRLAPGSRGGHSTRSSPLGAPASRSASSFREFRDVGLENNCWLILKNRRFGDFTPEADMGEGF